MYNLETQKNQKRILVLKGPPDLCPGDTKGVNLIVRPTPLGLPKVSRTGTVFNVQTSVDRYANFTIGLELPQ